MDSEKKRTPSLCSILKPSNSSNSTLLDNPCWGGRESNQQDLPYLLHLMDTKYFAMKTVTSKLNKQHDNELDNNNNHDFFDSKAKIKKMIMNNIVIYDDNDYLVLNKPPDLRMDGLHLATVHKLVTYLFPPPSLVDQIKQQQKQQQGNNNINVNDNQRHINSIGEDDLIDGILKLSKHSDLNDNIIRPTHQLDYATSGVLLLAKSKQAAAIACKAFEQRTTKKEYAALIWGHLNLHNISSTLRFPFLNDDQELLFAKWKDGTIENESKKERLYVKGGRKKLFTFVGYMPTHSIFAKWKAVRLKQRKRRKLDDKDCCGKDVSKKKNNKNDGNTDDEIWQMSPALTGPEEEELLHCSWKDVKSNPDKTNKQFFEELAKKINDIQRKEHEKKVEARKSNEEESIDVNKKLPTCFRVRGEMDNSFYVQIPLAEVKGDFRVTVEPEALKSLMEEEDCDASMIKMAMDQYCAKNPEELEFKPSLTKCVIQENGTWEGHKVTKVSLHPHTGRR